MVALEAREVALAALEQRRRDLEVARAPQGLALDVGRARGPVRDEPRRRLGLEARLERRERRALALETAATARDLATGLVDRLGEPLGGDLAADHVLGVRVDLGAGLGEPRRSGTSCCREAAHGLARAADGGADDVGAHEGDDAADDEAGEEELVS